MKVFPKESFSITIALLGACFCLLLAGSTAIAEDPAPEETGAAESGAFSIPEGQQTFEQFVSNRSDDVRIAAGFQIAQLRLGEDSAYVPIVVAMQSFKHKMWNVKMKDVIFSTEDGTELKPISLKEVRKQYSKYAEDYVFITRTTTLKQLLPSADISGAIMKERAGAADETQADGRVGGFGGADISLPESVSGGWYRHTLFYPSPGQTAVYSVTLDFKQFFYDIFYFKKEDVVGKPIRITVPAKKKRPAQELIFLIKSAD